MNPETRSPEKLTDQEIQDLAALWEQLGSGRKTEVTAGDPKPIKTELWKGLKTGFREDVLASINFERNLEMEKQISEQIEPAQKAALEMQLVRDYAQNISQMPHSMAMTPALIREAGGIDCTGATGLLATLLEDVGIQVAAGKLNLHRILVVTDSAGQKWYVDPRNNIIHRLTGASEATEWGEFYRFSEEDRRNPAIPFRLMLIQPTEEGIVDSVLGNINVLARQTHKDDEDGQKEFADFYQRHQVTVDKQDWKQIHRKLFPGLNEFLDQELFQQSEKEYTRMAMYDLDKIINEILAAAGQEPSSQWHQSYRFDLLQHKDAVLTALAGDTDFPDTLPTDLINLLQELCRRIQALPEPRRQYALEEISRRLHGNYENETS